MGRPASFLLPFETCFQHLISSWCLRCLFWVKSVLITFCRQLRACGGHSGVGLQAHSSCLSGMTLDFVSDSLVLTLFWRKPVTTSRNLHLVAKCPWFGNTAKLLPCRSSGSRELSIYTYSIYVKHYVIYVGTCEYACTCQHWFISTELKIW